MKKDFVQNVYAGGMLVKFSFDAFSHKKGVLYRSFNGDATTRYPPYHHNLGVDLSTEEVKEPPVDIGINQWYSLYPSRGLKRPRGPKRARTEAEGSESEAEDVKGAEEDDNVRLLTRMLNVLKATRSEQTNAHAAQREEIRAVKDEIIREITTSEGRTRAMINDVEDGLMQDFTELRTELKISPYNRQKKAHPFAPSHARPTGGPTISEEAAQICIATEMFLKELADKEAAARDPSGKGKRKLSRTL
ncbi:hypothetical protein LWI28_013198 [Acer negundo]|uniref:Uncharacterized protein n=1 Tax=Acer negundo TaxID=4023 RepID=A0AAD5IJA0_ACENE|nr:hypothetical protein LWI28_013198 [Acer negundo]